jgi:hypothetical protein
MQRHDLQLFADYYQFYLQDDDSEYGDLAEAWTDEAMERALAVAPHVVGIGTARHVAVPVTIEIHESRPPIDLSTWDRVNLASLQVDTGRVAVAGCTDYFPDALRIKVAPGAYEVLVCYSGLSSVSNDGLEGDDRYWIALYPGNLQAVTVLKERADG